MRIFPIILLAFLIIPLVEITVLIQVGGIVGVWTTVGLVVLTAVVGAALMRSEGLATLARVQNEMHRGGLPAQEIIEGALLLGAGALLLTPGFITDAVGFVVLFRPTRIAIARWFMARAVVAVDSAGRRPGPGSPGGRTGTGPGRGNANGVIEGDYSREDR